MSDDPTKYRFYHFVRTDGHFVDVVYSKPPDGETALLNARVSSLVT